MKKQLFGTSGLVVETVSFIYFEEHKRPRNLQKLFRGFVCFEFFLKIYRTLNCVCAHTHMCMQASKACEQAIRVPGAGVTGGRWVLGIRLRSSARAARS